MIPVLPICLPVLNFDSGIHKKEPALVKCSLFLVEAMRQLLQHLLYGARRGRQAWLNRWPGIEQQVQSCRPQTAAGVLRGGATRTLDKFYSIVWGMFRDCLALRLVVQPFKRTTNLPIFLITIITVEVRNVRLLWFMFLSPSYKNVTDAPQTLVSLS